MATLRGTATFDETGAFQFKPDDGTKPESPAEFWDVSELDNSLDEYPAPTDRKPGYLEPFEDPRFLNRVTRISGDPGTQIGDLEARWGDVVSHHYSKDQAWNCDQTLIYLDSNDGGQGGGGVFLNGETYEPEFMRGAIPSNADVRWHHSDPDLMFYAADSVLGTWNVRTDERKTIKQFDGYDNLKFGPWEGNFSLDGDCVALSIGEEGGFFYRLSSDTKGPDIFASSISDFETIGSVSVSPLGTSLVWNLEDDSVVITDLEGTVLRSTPPNRISHFDLTLDGDGEEVMVGRKNDGGGHILKIRLSDLRETELTKGGFGQHTGARGRCLYCVSDFVDNRPNHQPYEGEICLISLDGSAVYRLCHHHGSKNPDYKSEFHASMSPDGGRVIFASTWDVGGSTPRPVQTYVVDIRTAP